MLFPAGIHPLTTVLNIKSNDLFMPFLKGMMRRIGSKEIDCDEKFFDLNSFNASSSFWPLWQSLDVSKSKHSSMSSYQTKY